MYDESTDVPALAGFHQDGLITDVTDLIKSGKEATVYRCQVNPARRRRIDRQPRCAGRSGCRRSDPREPDRRRRLRG